MKDKPTYKTTSPVLFIIFNRPDTTAQVFKKIEAAKPERLYIAADGFRANRPDEQHLVNLVREIATNICWNCEVKTLFQKENLGCKKSVSGAINWFFENEKQGIILEDDCLPHEDFFRFCDELLEMYQNNERVFAITGNNFQEGINRGDSYYFSKYCHIWGWASWRRAWHKNDLQMNFWPSWKKSSAFFGINPDRVESSYWTKIFDRMHANRIDTWDYAWLASNWYHRGLTITPNINLVSNIGFGANATHTHSADNKYANMPTEPIGVLTHPSKIQVDSAADLFVFNHHFGGFEARFPRNALTFPKRLLKKVKRMLISTFQS